MTAQTGSSVTVAVRGDHRLLRLDVDHWILVGPDDGTDIAWVDEYLEESWTVEWLTVGRNLVSHYRRDTRDTPTGS